MPHLVDNLKTRLVEHPGLASHPGELNFVDTIRKLTFWTNDRQYSTIHQIAKATLQNIVGSTMSDKQVADFLAFMEFYRQVGAKYEDIKIEQNGNVYDSELKYLETLR